VHEIEVISVNLTLFVPVPNEGAMENAENIPNNFCYSAMIFIFILSKILEQKVGDPGRLLGRVMQLL